MITVIECTGVGESSCGECPLCTPPQGARDGFMADTPAFRRLTLCAASQAATATADLMQAGLEGPQHHVELFSDEPIEKLADATKLAIEASLEAGQPLDDLRGQLLGALTRYLEGWYG